MKSNIVNIDDLPWKLNEHGDFAYEDKWLAAETGGQKLGATLYMLFYDDLPRCCRISRFK